MGWTIDLLNLLKVVASRAVHCISLTLVIYLHVHMPSYAFHSNTGLSGGIRFMISCHLGQSLAAWLASAKEYNVLLSAVCFHTVWPSLRWSPPWSVSFNSPFHSNLRETCYWSGDVCTGLGIIWYAINHTTCTDQNQSQNMRWSKAIIRSIFVPHSTLFIFYLWSHKNE